MPLTSQTSSNSQSGGHEVDAQVQVGPKAHVGEGFGLCIHIVADRKSLNSNSQIHNLHLSIHPGNWYILFHPPHPCLELIVSCMGFAIPASSSPTKPSACFSRFGIDIDTVQGQYLYCAQRASRILTAATETSPLDGSVEDLTSLPSLS